MNKEALHKLFNIILDLTVKILYLTETLCVKLSLR